MVSEIMSPQPSMQCPPRSFDDIIDKALAVFKNMIPSGI